MGRTVRLEDASCAICMDALFNQRDDLDEVLHIATPDCGHVFHEKCLLEWFKSQANQYLAMAREQGIEAPSTADAAAECPNCRTECFADTETGEPAIHRLFIDFGDDDNDHGDGAGASGKVGGRRSGIGLPQTQSSTSLSGSSPMRGGWGARGGERDLLSLARRARQLGNEVDALNADSSEEDFEGTMRRVEGLKDDAMSTKACDGFKTYLGGLTVAIDRLRKRIADHPLIATLQGRLDEARNQLEDSQRTIATFETVVLPREVRKVQEAERARYDKLVKRANDKSDLIQRELEKEKVARVASKRAAQEREAENERRLGEARRIADNEKSDRAALATMLEERSKSVKMLKQRLDKSKLKVDELTAEIATLRAAAAKRNEPRNDPHDIVDVLGMTLSDDEPDLGSHSGDTSMDNDLSAADISMEEMADTAYRNLVKAYGKRQAEEDSLVVDLPGLEVEFGSSIAASGSRSKSRAGPRSVTARTFTFDMDDGLVRPRKDKGKSKYFTSTSTVVSAAAEDAYDDEHAETSRVLVPPSSPFISPAKRSRTNPFRMDVGPNAGAPNEPRRRRLTTPPPQKIEVVELISSPDSDIQESGPSCSRSAHLTRPPLGPSRRTETNSPRRGGTTSLSEKSMIDFLGVVDGAGRLKRGVAVGAKVKRRA